MSIDGFSAFEDIGMSNTPAIDKEGLRYRDTILSLGGARAPGLVFQVSIKHQMCGNVVPLEDCSLNTKRALSQTKSHG